MFCNFSCLKGILGLEEIAAYLLRDLPVFYISLTAQIHPAAAASDQE